ncbi:amidohydrolase [Streptomyces sp. enrichment culture]|uniref:amidohydrolase n=1 Tax=Streptomyces sp. enrichment culture TaxID=1795815 RepID=UPI003F55DC32
MTDTARLTEDLTSAVAHDELAAFYQDLHRHPELSFKEHRTAAGLALRLRAAGFTVTEGIAGTGVVGVLHAGDGPVVWLRGDMDALPVREATGLPYASTVDGVMHACGHDLHVTWLAAAAEALAAGRDSWSGTLVVVGQTAEEAGGGAAMVADGLHERFPRADVLLGQHVTPGLAGFYPHTPGLIMSASNNVDVVVHGVGGHGSRPETTVDPVVTAAYIVTRLQTVVSRETAARDSAVLTVGEFHAGTKPNVIPAEARLAVNLRTQDAGVRDRILAAVRRIVEGECAAAGCPVPPEVTVRPGGYPLTVNDPALDAEIAAVHRELFGAETVLDLGPAMGSEDFSLLVPNGVPYDYWFVTSTPPEVWEAAPGEGLEEKFAAVPSNHSPLFAPDLSVLVPGVRTLVSAALTRLSV